MRELPVCAFMYACEALCFFIFPALLQHKFKFLQDAENCWVPKGLLMQMSQIQLK